MNQPALFRSTVVHMILKGHCPSKKNLWRAGKGGHRYLDKTARSQIETLTAQALDQWILNGPGRLRPCLHPDIQVRFFTRDQRSDRDNKLTTILDCLRDAGVIQNDNIARFNGVITLWPATIDPEERVELVISFG